MRLIRQGYVEVNEELYKRAEHAQCIECGSYNTLSWRGEAHYCLKCGWRWMTSVQKKT